MLANRGHAFLLPEHRLFDAADLRHRIFEIDFLARMGRRTARRLRGNFNQHHMDFRFAGHVFDGYTNSQIFQLKKKTKTRIITAHNVLTGVMIQSIGMPFWFVQKKVA